MTYIPKSKLNIKETNGQEFQLISNKKAYVGRYMQLSNGKIFAGSDPLNPGGELEPINVPINNLGYSRDVRIYKALKPEISSYVGKIKDIPFSKNTPTEDNYSNGYFTRYFVKKINQNNFYKEISKEVYNSLKKKKSEYDINLYTDNPSDFFKKYDYDTELKILTQTMMDYLELSDQSKKKDGG